MANWDYHRLGSIMSRWSFKSKMTMVEEYSQRLIDPNAVGNPSVLRNMVLPEELETFTMFAIMNKEWQNHRIDKNEFARAISTIRSYKHSQLVSRLGTEFGDWYIIMAAASQFDIQSNQIYRIARYLFYFSFSNDNIDMDKEFSDQFGITYKELSAPIIFIWWCLMKDSAYHFDKESADWILKKYRKSLDLLTLEREEHISKIDEITSNIEDYKYCFRPLYTHPFVIDDGIQYMPLPHLLIRAVTESMMHRLTDRKNELRKKIGKEVFESYLLKVLEECGLFDEIIPEQEYSIGKQQNQKTMDAMTHIGDTIICFDSKSFTPCISLRVFSESGYSNAIDRIAEGVEQAYNQTYKKYDVEYSYLSVEVDPNRSNIYGVFVLQENPFVPLDKVYQKAAKRLGIAIGSCEYDWMRGHVGWVGLDQLEVELFQGKDFIYTLTANERNKTYDDHWFLQVNQKDEVDIPDFVRDAVHKQILYVGDEMNKDGVSILVNQNYVEKLKEMKESRKSEVEEHTNA